MTPRWRNCSHAVACQGSVVQRRPSTPRFQTASAAASQAKTRLRWVFRPGSSALPRRTRFSPSAASGRSLCASIQPWRPEPHVRKRLARALCAQLVFEDTEDENIPPAAVPVTGLAEHALLAEAVAPQGVGTQ